MKSNSIISLILLMILVSCASENDSLVNPPPRFETVKVRFYNLASDGKARSFTMETTLMAPSIGNGNLSALVQPPADSVLLQTMLSDAIEYKSTQRFIFGRNTNYTFIGLPSAKSAPNQKPLDTIIAFGTSYSISQNPNEAYIKIFNANPDSTISYSLNEGCPNGPSLASSLHYRKYSLSQPIRSGEVPLSITKRRGQADSLVGLFSFSFAQKGQYTIIIKPNAIGGEEILLLDELNESTNALSIPPRISERFTELRALNFSTEPISIYKAPGEEIVDGLIPHFIENYKKFSACNSVDKDTLELFIGSSKKTHIASSFEVLEKYSVAVFDSASNKGAAMVIVPPVRLTEDLGNRAIVRVINGNYLQNGVSVSLGAREIVGATGEDAERGFRAGESLADRIKFGEITKSNLISPGLLPIAVFTSSEPAKLITTARARVESGKSYLLIIYSDETGKELISLIEDGVQNQLIQSEPEGVFVQAIHGTAGKDFVSVEFPELFSKAKLNFTGSLASVIPAGEHTLYIDGISHTINASPSDRVLVISSGTLDQQEVFDITAPPLFANSNYYVRRYINASKEINKLNVLNNDSLVVMPNVEYMKRSSFEKIYQEKKFSLLFQNSETQEDLVRIGDLFLTYSKTFSIIFVGSKRYSGYAVIVQQEY